MEDKRVEQRTCPRSRVVIRVEVRLKCGVIVDGAAVDISQGGLLFETERMIPLDCPVKVTLVHEGGSPEHHFECQGTVSRLDPRGVAIVFEEMNAENAARLDHLLELGGDWMEEPVLSGSFEGEFY